jgi:hypothetical protein
MGAKLLFVFGIVVAHGVMAAGLVAQEAPKQRAAIATCVRTPSAPIHISPPREIYAMLVIPLVNHEARQP